MPARATLDGERLNELRQALGDDRLQGLVGIFFTDLAERPDRIASHLRSGDLQRVRAEAHSLKGAALSIGAIQIGRAAAALELALPGTEMVIAAERLERVVATALNHWHVPKPSL